MTVLSAVLGFTVVAGLLTITPGLDTALVLRSSLAQSRRQAFATAAGVCCGVFVWGIAAAVGVSALLTASTVAYDVIKLLGAVYMVWLGAKLLHSAITSKAPEHGLQTDPAAGAWRAARRGFLTNLLNPKLVAFYVAVLPQFLPDDVPALAMGALLALIHVVLGMVWFTSIIVGASRMRRLLTSRRSLKVIDGTTGSVLVGFGVRLGFDSR